MSSKSLHTRLPLIAMAVLFAILMASFALVALAGSPAKVMFSTSGLPDGISLTVNGLHTNPGGHEPLSFSTTFTSPGPSGGISSEAFTVLTYTFPASIPSGGGFFTLVSTSENNPLTLGAPGSTISVEATYAACSAISFDTQPVDLTAELDSPATFSVTVTGLLPEYQWRRNGMDIQGANSSSYTISSVDWSDHGDSFDVVVTNGCSSATSDAGTLTVTKKNQTISFSQPASPQAYQASFGLSATATSGLPVTFSVTGGCSLDGANVTMTSGTAACVITAKQVGNSEYSAASDVIRTVNAAKVDQAIDFSKPASPQTYGNKFPVGPTSDSGLVVRVNASGSCSIAAGEVTMTSGTGDCILTASQAGDENYNPAGDVSWTVAAAKADQAITFAAPASPAAYGSQFSVSPSADSGLAVTLGASGGCSNSESNITMISSTQACILTASQAGDENYNPATDVTRTVAAAKADQSITFVAPASPAAYGTQFSVSPTSTSNLVVSVEASGSCSYAAGKVTMTSGTGDCTLTASQAGDANYNPAQNITRTVVAVKANQVITFAQPTSPVIAGSSFEISPTADSGLAVSVVASGACSLSGDTVNVSMTPGSCTLTASQPGNAFYDAAPTVARTVEVKFKSGQVFFPILYSR